MKQSIYLDHAATTPVDPQVLQAMQPYMNERFYNPSSLYQAARDVRGAVEAARWQVAQTLGAQKSEIIFTAGGTESVNLAILGVLRALRVIPSSVEGSLRFVTTAIEHEAVLATLLILEREGVAVTVVPVKPDGIVDVDKLIEAIDDQTALVSVMYANNEIGTIQPIAEIAKAVAAIRRDRTKRGVSTPLYLHTDACQAGGLLDLHVSRLGVDLMTLNGSKIYGPKQIGCLYVRTGTPLESLIYGGGQERGWRSGTENVAGLVGFAVALELAQSRRDDEAKRLTNLRDDTVKALTQAIPDLILNGHPTKRLASNINLTIPGINGETAVLYLDREGIMVSTGSACSTGKADPSHVLLALGRSRSEAEASLRLTLGRATTKADLQTVVTILPSIIKRLRQLA